MIGADGVVASHCHMQFAGEDSVERRHCGVANDEAVALRQKGAGVVAIQIGGDVAPGWVLVRRVRVPDDDAGTGVEAHGRVVLNEYGLLA